MHFHWTSETHHPLLQSAYDTYCAAGDSLNGKRCYKETSLLPGTRRGKSARFLRRTDVVLRPTTKRSRGRGQLQQLASPKDPRQWIPGQ